MADVFYHCANAVQLVGPHIPTASSQEHPRADGNTPHREYSALIFCHL